MAKTVRDMLENALYLSISDRQFSPVDPSGSDINVALNIFGGVIDSYRNLIPFFTEVERDAVDLTDFKVGSINVINYILGGTTYTVKSVTQKEFAEIARIVKLNNIPEVYWYDQANSVIRVYPQPISPTDKFVIGFRPLGDAFELEASVPSQIPAFMQQFLQYEVAHELCNQYNVPWSSSKEASRQRYYQTTIENNEYIPSQPVKPRIGTYRSNVPWLAYLSGNTPGSP